MEHVTYMHWAKTKGPARYDLSLSGMPSLKTADVGVSLDGLEISGDHSYGYQPLLEAVARRYGVTSGEVFSSFGTSHGFFGVMAALCDRGDDVVVEKPTYGPFLAAASFLGLGIKRLERRYEDGFAVRPDDLDGLLGGRTRLVVLANPHNPSGKLLPRETMGLIAAKAAARGAFVLVDEVYLDFAEGPNGRTAHGLGDNVIVTSSLTKVYGLSGLRCGWVVARPDVVEKLRMFMDHATPEHVFMTEQMASRILPGIDALRRRTEAFRRRNLDLVAGFMEGESRLEWVKPDTGIICFPRLKGRPSADGFAAMLLEKFGTRIVPGSFFECPAHFRLGFGVPEDILAPGLDSIKRALDLL